MDVLLNEKIGNRIKGIRRSRKLTQEKLAEASNLSPSYISRIEGGGSAASLDALCSIAGALGVGIESFLCDLFLTAPDDEAVKEITIAVSALSSDKQKAALYYIKYLSSTDFKP